MNDFKTKKEIVEYIRSFKPAAYANSRNFLNGSVSYLSPYINLGVVTLPEVKRISLEKTSLARSTKWIQELSWRDFFVSVYQAKGNDIFDSIKNPQEEVISDKIPKAILEAKTGIEIIDSAILKLYQTGYLHNHERMWIASIVCNIAKTDWKVGADWMYNNLIDGNYASNMLSWQWICGTFSSKKYYANQDNINKYSGSVQKNTFLDFDYDHIATMPIPEVLIERADYKVYNDFFINEDQKFTYKNNSTLVLIGENSINSNSNLPKTDVVLFIDSELLDKHPMSIHKWNLIQYWLKEEIPKAKILITTKAELELLKQKYSKVVDQPIVRLYPSLNRYYPSFFKFWIEAETLIRN
ncbi:MAG: FAD-binding domain-containing protein [Patescibacteria group bacterium]